MFHTNFDLVARLLPNRTRTMVRNKYRAEDKNNSAKVTLYLSAKMRLPYGMHAAYSNVITLTRCRS